MNKTIEANEINKIHRIGKNKQGNKPRPILCSFVNGWKRTEIMQNKKALKKIYIMEDYSKEVMEKRKALQPELLAEREKGNIAYLKYDKLIIKENNYDKRKRELSYSPQSPSKNQPKKQQTINTAKIKRTNAFDVMRGRSNSLNIDFSKKQ